MSRMSRPMKTVLAACIGIACLGIVGDYASGNYVLFGIACFCLGGLIALIAVA